MLKKLWDDEVGAVISAELVMITTVLGIGMIVGLKSVRDAIVTEFADVGQAIANLNQSYSYGGVSSLAAMSSGSFFNDAPDFGDLAGSGGAFSNSRCIVLTSSATSEGSSL